MMIRELSKLRLSLRVLPVVLHRGVAGGTPVLIGFYIAHRWGLAEFGAYTLAIAMVTVGLVITDWGCSRSLPRELAVLPRPAAEAFVASTNVTRILIFAVLASAAWVATKISMIRPDVVPYLWIVAPWALVTIWSTNGISARIVNDEIEGIAISAAVGLLVLGVLIWGAVHFGLGPHAVAVAYVVAKFVEAVILIGTRWWLLGVQWQHVARAFSVLWPFSIQGILLVVYSRLPLFVTEHLGTPVQVGIVSAGSALQSVLLLLPACTVFVALPQLSVAVREDRRRIRRIIQDYLLISAVGMAAGIIGLVLIRELIARVLRIPHADVVFVIWFAAVSAVTLGTAILSVLLQAHNEEAIVARVWMVTVVLALAYQILFVRAFGVWGLIAGVIAAEASSVLLLSWRYARIVRSERRPAAESAEVLQKRG